MNVKGGERSRINWIGLFCELFAGRSFQRESQCESTIGTKYFLITAILHFSGTEGNIIDIYINN